MSERIALAALACLTLALEGQAEKLEILELELEDNGLFELAEAARTVLIPLARWVRARAERSAAQG